MDEIIVGIFKFQSDFALEVWFSICWKITVSEMHKITNAVFYDTRTKWLCTKQKLGSATLPTQSVQSDSHCSALNG